MVFPKKMGLHVLQNCAVDMKKTPAASAFEMMVLGTGRRRIDILIAGAGPFHHIFAHHSLFHQGLQIAVYGGFPNRRPLLLQKGGQPIGGDMGAIGFPQDTKDVFPLFCICLLYTSDAADD